MSAAKFISPIFVLLLLFGCSSKPQRARYITFQKPQSFGSKLIYHGVKTATNTAIHPRSPSERDLRGLSRLKDLGEELLNDLGAITISLTTEDGDTIEGTYLDPASFRMNQTGAYKKWRTILKSPRNCRLADIFESDFSGNSLLSLFALPKSLQPIQAAKKKPLGVLILPEYGLTYQLDPKTVLMFAARGLHVFAINYRSEDKIPEWKSTCDDASIAFQWLKARLKAPSEEMIIFGKSFGTGPAIYLATQNHHSNLILERPFARMSDLCDYHQTGPLSLIVSPFAKAFVEKYFRYPNEDWIAKVKGRILLIESVDDLAVQGHAERLFHAATQKLSEAQKKAFSEKYWLKFKGSHYGRFWGDPCDTWYTREINQERLSEFLKEL